MQLEAIDLVDLRFAKTLLEHTGLAARMADAVGAPVEKLLAMLPSGAAEMLGAATNKSITAALRVALSTLGESPRMPMDWLNKVVAGATGAAGGAFGLPGLAIELPVSTMVILRSIAEIARNEGEILTSPEARLACIQVFAFGGTASADDAAETGYFAVRMALATSVSEAVEHIARRGLADHTAPAIVRLTAQIAARFGIPVSQKLIAQSVPLIGAAGGALVNVLFIDHFQNMARGHFIVRRLERKYGFEAIQTAYSSLPRDARM